MTITTEDVIDAIYMRHNPREGWVVVDEVKVSTGIGFGVSKYFDVQNHDLDQRIDVFAINTWPSRGFLRVAYEVKVSRSDFLKEMADSNKRKTAMNLSNEFYFAAPSGVIGNSDLPKECGLIEMDEYGIARKTKAAQYREIGSEIPLPFVCSLLKNASNQRSVSRRCGAEGCGRVMTRRIEVLDGKRRSSAMPFCEYHATVWEQAMKMRDIDGARDSVAYTVRQQCLVDENKVKNSRESII